MRDKSYLHSLLEYNSWANAELYTKVRALPPEEVTRKRKTLLESIHLSLNHLLAVDRMWHAHMQRRDHGIKELRASVLAVNQASRGVVRKAGYKAPHILFRRPV